MDSWARMVRTSCSHCGATPIAWTSAVQLLLVTDDLESRKRLAEIVNLYGGDAEAWQCHHCGEWGVFGPTEVVIPVVSRRERRAAARRHRRAS